MSSRARIIVAVVVLLGLTACVVGIVVWSDRTGCVSYTNYERITKGMELSQVEALLGSTGEEITFDRVPQLPPWAKQRDSPDGWLGVVWGDRFFIWQSADRTIHIGIRDGKVVSKSYWEPSL